MNEWTISGEVFYLRGLDGEFSASIRLRGISRREGFDSTQVLEVGCLMCRKAWEEACVKGVELYRRVTLSGHIESWTKAYEHKEERKIMLIADHVLSVA